MSKIRINELARELEVPNNRILELLPGLGVTEKKTHSSSIDDDVAIKIRHIIGGESGDESPAAEFEEQPADSPAAASGGETAEAPQQESARGTEPELPSESPAAVEVAPPAPASPPSAEATRRPIQPLRPPIGGGPREPLPPGTQTPSPAPSAPPVQRNVAIPARPAPPPPRPGQILSGPRQPLPAGFGETAKIEPGRPIAPPPRPVPPPAQTRESQAGPGPALPRPPINRPPSPPAPGAPSIAIPQPPRQPSRPLAGQPAARPVVPPRPDLVDRLNKAKMPATPPPPRPGMPTQRPQSPVPGQPIYRGPIRPGQPIMRGPGAPGAPGQSPGGRPMMRQRMHPTSPARGMEPPPPPTTDQRRDGKRARPVARRDEPEERALRQPTRRQEQVLPQIDREITVADGITVKELSEKLGVKANLLIKKLVERKIFATINQSLEVKLAEELARQFGASTNKVSFEQESTQEVELAEDTKELVRRAPVVTIMGHVDHGKTSLLDAIRETNVAGREAGGITQHIGAYHIEKNGRKIVFIDTPGHEAFTRMRARGAKVTDIVILVVGADDGVMPQTLEAIDHARAAGVPIIVAINKIDKQDAQPERIKQQLADRNLLAEDWGGDVVMVPVSAKAKTNLDLLLEMILLVSDMLDLKANPARPAMGNVLEAQLDRGRGPVATVLVRNGTLRVGDHFICGSVFSKVRAMFDDRGQAIREAEPSMPVEVLGLDSLPDVGDNFQVVTDTAKAKQIVIYRESKAREQAMAKNTRMTLEQLHQQLREGEVKDLNLIVKADVGGSAEVLADTLQKLSNDKVRVRVLRTGVGAITEYDVLLASASNAIIVGFNVRPERTAATTAEKEKVDIRLHTIIYEVMDEIRKAMTGMLEPVFKEVYKGRASVRETYRISKVGTVAGCMVVDGSIARDGQIRLLRDNIVVHTGKIAALKRFKNDASEVKTGFECGISLENFNDIKPGDVIEGFATERVAVEALV